MSEIRTMSRGSEHLDCRTKCDIILHSPIFTHRLCCWTYTFSF